MGRKILKKLNSEVKLNKQKHKYNLPNITTIQKVLKSRSQKKRFWKQSLLCNLRLLEKTNLCNSVFSIGDKMSRFRLLYPDLYMLLKNVHRIFVFTHPRPLSWSLSVAPNLCLSALAHNLWLSDLASNLCLQKSRA